MKIFDVLGDNTTTQLIRNELRLRGGRNLKNLVKRSNPKEEDTCTDAEAIERAPRDTSTFDIES